ncbi:hypothetical protein ACFPK9_11550 [Rubritalea spongiae]|uniref:Uncharacterized protein n=1 Tax=Rubritalea spongiae TaxID=430797 RepID=A0ABW5E069_9BACT
MNTNENNDPVWKLLENASEQKASPLFSRNVMRDVRQEEQLSKPWWKKLLSPAPVIGTLTTAAACVALIISTQPTEVPYAPPVAQTETISADQGLNALADTIPTDDSFSDLIDPLSLVASSDIELLSDFEMLMEL